MKTNEFAKIAKLVDNLVTRYREVRKDCGISDTGWHSRTIESMAKPFIKGYFTLAVVGKVSSGKSTFINALLGCKDLLPTGHDQTTCGVTSIEYGEKPEITIEFGDGHKKVITGNDISGKLKPFVAIPEKYHHLPVNNIDDMIMAGWDFNLIWEAHEELQEQTLCPPINETLLKDYVLQRKKKDIAVNVLMKYPFNEELKGWRVIDTPGIGAIGGIENRTRKLLGSQKEDGTREVDAIIFLQNGSETLDQADSKIFVKEQLDNMSELDKERLFFVLTHSGSVEFRNNKESKIDFIKKNYGDKIKVLTYADSLLYTFLNDLESRDDSLDDFISFKKFKGWEEGEWVTIMSVLFQAMLHVKDTDSFNHDTMLRTIQEWSNFEELKKEINIFAKNEKEKTLRTLLSYIITDYGGFVDQLRKDIKLVNGNLDDINKEIQKVKDKKQEYNLLAQKADDLIKIDRINAEFAFIEEELHAIDNLQSENSVRTSVTNLFDKVQKQEKAFFDNIIKQFSDFFTESDNSDIILASIDFKAIETEAEKFDKDKYMISPSRTVTHWCSADEYIPAKYDNKKIEQEKFRNFKTLALKRARSQRDKFLPQVKKKVENMRDKIFDELNDKLNEKTVHYEELKSDLDRKEVFKANKEAIIEKTITASKELQKIAQDYGYKL